MKFLRKISAFFISIIIFATILIGVGKIFAIKNVNVTIITYADDGQEKHAELKELLRTIEGELIVFIDESTITTLLAEKSDQSYSVMSFEKIYPCTINVSLKDRVETFSVNIGKTQYSMYDSDGVFIKGSTSNDNVGVDGFANVELIGIEIDSIQEVAGYAKVFKEYFKGLRSIVSSIKIDTKTVDGSTDKLVFNLYCGLKIQIDDYKRDIVDKVKVAYDKFTKLTDREKLSGTLRSYRFANENGSINADYSPY